MIALALILPLLGGLVTTIMGGDYPLASSTGGGVLGGEGGRLRVKESRNL